MADNFAANIVPEDTAADFPRGNMLRETLKSTPRPADSDENDFIQPYAIGYQHDDDDYHDKPTENDENFCIQPYAVGHPDADDDYDDKSTKHGESHSIQPYSVRYIDTDGNDDCDNTCIQPYAVGYQDADDNYAHKSSDSETNPTDGEVQPYTDACLQTRDKRDELLQKSEAAATDSSNIPVNTTGRDSSEDDTEASTLAGYDSHVLETRCPLRSSEDDTETSTIAVYDGNTENPDSMYAPNDVHPNPIYPQHAGNTSPIHQQHAMKPNPIYPQNNRNSDLTDEPNLLHQPAGPADSDDNPCIQPYAVRYKHEDGDDENRKHAEGDRNHCIQPYAVRYKHEDGDDENRNHAEGDRNHCIQPYAVRYKHEDGDDENRKHAEGDRNHCIQPYAVRYGHDDDNNKDTERDDNPSFLPYAVRYLQTDYDDDNTAQGAAALTEQTTETSPTDVDIQPYAVAYMCQDDVAFTASSLEETQTKEPLRKIKTVSNNGNDIQSNMSGRGPFNDDTDTLGFTDGHSRLRRVRHPLKTLHPHPTDVQNVLNPNPMSTVLNALIPNQAYAQTAQIRNPIYVANVPQQRAYGRRYLPVLITCILVLSLVIGGIIAGFPFRTRDIELQKITSDSFWTTKTTQSWTSYSSQDTNNGKVNLEKILFGGTGKDPGRFHMHSSHGMVVSAANEIFVTDYYNERVQVFSMDGVFLRLFPTVVPGDNENSTMHPSDIAIDRDGHLWVTGAERVVQYTQNGVVLTNFKIQPFRWKPRIAFDAFGVKILVMGPGIVLMFHSNGSFHHSFQIESFFANSYLTTDNEGNIFVSNPAYVSSFVTVYNHSGHSLFKFGGFGRAEGQLAYPRSIGIDSSGSILIANQGNNRVDMFTRLGKFVRTVVNVTKPTGLAVGPNGDLVVTSGNWRNMVAIFPHQMVYP
ncbi:uncharacterized protein LOC144907145 [Branchiostoma floridae x Branchiostoma belcheri]